MKSIQSLFFKQDDNLVATTANLLKLLNIKVTSSHIKDTILSNPNYPSLLTVSDSLKLWGVDSEAYLVETDKIDLLPTPFIAHFRSASFATVKAISTDTVTYLEDDGSETMVMTKDFLNKWSGNALLAEVEIGQGQQDYKKANRKEWLNAMRLPLLIALLGFAGIWQFVQNYSLFVGAERNAYIGYWFFTITGTIVAGLLLLLDYDHNNTYLKKLCSINKNTDCNAVLNSKGSKIWGFSWSELGFFYFLGQFLYLIINPYHPNALFPLTLLSIVALPYIIYSIYYQYAVVKQWCVLCLTIQAILLGEFLTSLLTSRIYASFIADQPNLSVISIIVAFAFPLVIWMLVKPYLYDAREKEKTSFSFKRFKNNSEVFDSILQSQPALKNDTKGLGILLGNPEAANTLIKVCNPYCGPCAQSYPHLQKLLKANPNWKIQVIFTATPDPGDYRALPVAHFLAAQDHETDNTKVVEVMADWYNAKEKDYTAYTKRNPLNVNFETQQPRLAAMADWCNREHIPHTPSYFVNGRALPETYSVEDLMFIS